MFATGKGPRVGVPGRVAGHALLAIWIIGAVSLAVEATPGAAHPGRPYPVETGFVVTIPNGPARSAIDGSNWEGRGVTPDVATTASAVLDVAREHARNALKGG